MSDIFLSYKSEDRAKAKIIAEALENQGYSVWWDRIISPGKTFDEVIKEALDDAKCVIVLWSKKSVVSEWVKEEAEKGKKKQILVPVLIDDVEIPMGFGRIQAAQLVDWEGKLPNPEFDLLLKSVGEILGKPPVRKKKVKKTSITELNQYPEKISTIDEIKKPISRIEEGHLEKKTYYRKILLIAIVLIAVAGIFLLTIQNDTQTLTLSFIKSADIVTPNGTSKIILHVAASEGAPVGGANVILSATGGRFNPTIGTTDMNGDFKSTYTPGTAGLFTISATASKTGYKDGSGSDQLTVSPSLQQLFISVTESPDPVVASGTSQVTVHVTSSGGTPVSGTSVSLSATGGSLNPTTGTTDTNGDLNSTYTQGTSGLYTISATASKTGYKDGSGSDQLIVSPAGFRIVEVILRADPYNYTGPCPVKITFSGRISVAGGSGTVSYKFIRSDRASAPIQTLQFNLSGSKDVSTTWYIGGSNMQYSGWEAIKTFDPQEVESQHAAFNIQCN